MDRYCFSCGAYIGEPIEAVGNWETLISGTKLYKSSTVAEENETSKIYRIVKEYINNMVNAFSTLFKNPATGAHIVLGNYNEGFTTGFASVILFIETALSYFTLKSFKITLTNLDWIQLIVTIGILCLGVLFVNVIVSCCIYISCLYILKNRSKLLIIWKICTISNTIILSSISIVLIFRIIGSLSELFVLFIGFMISALALFTCLNKKLELSEDKAAMLSFFTYVFYIGSIASYYFVFIK